MYVYMYMYMYVCMYWRWCLIAGIEDDLLSTGIMLYHLKQGTTVIGRDNKDDSNKPDIVLQGTPACTHVYVHVHVRVYMQEYMYMYMYMLFPSILNSVSKHTT